MQYSNWKKRDLNVTSLRLDPDNPRLMTSLNRPTQQQLIQELLSQEEVLELARDISKQGFFPNDLLVATKEGANFIILEGNRRLAALKLLLNPELAPQSFQKRIKHCADHCVAKTTKVSAIIAPSRDAAVPLIMRVIKDNR